MQVLMLEKVMCLSNTSANSCSARKVVPSACYRPCNIGLQILHNNSNLCSNYSMHHSSAKLVFLN